MGPYKQRGGERIQHTQNNTFDGFASHKPLCFHLQTEFWFFFFCVAYSSLLQQEHLFFTSPLTDEICDRKVKLNQVLFVHSIFFCSNRQKAIIKCSVLNYIIQQLSYKTYPSSDSHGCHWRERVRWSWSVLLLKNVAAALKWLQGFITPHSSAAHMTVYFTLTLLSNHANPH